MEREVETAEEIIVTVYQQMTEIRQAGGIAEGILLTQDRYRQLQQYRARLGTLPEGMPDYITKDALFGLPIFAGSADDPAIQVF